jgi:hypothetical protein
VLREYFKFLIIQMARPGTFDSGNLVPYEAFLGSPIGKKILALGGQINRSTKNPKE